MQMRREEYWYGRVYINLLNSSQPVPEGVALGVVDGLVDGVALGVVDGEEVGLMEGIEVGTAMIKETKL